jgi:predicted nuclease of predicted toxin-antitoxin system
LKLLFDQNLSPKLVRSLSDLFPGSIHVQTVNLDTANDSVLWKFAREKGFIIVSKDVDFSDLSVIAGYPPKVIWIRRGNCSTKQIEAILCGHFNDIKNLDESPDIGVLTIF